jgi:putative ABC transport system permease protein
MPEETVRHFAKYDRVFLSFNHLVAMLQRRYRLDGQDVLLTGMAAAITAPAQRQRPMGYDLAPGQVTVGFQVAQRLGLKKGDTLEIGGRRLKVERALVESGTDDDVRVFVALADAQGVLGLEGRINEIKAIDCLCLTADQNPLKLLRAELDKALPEAKVLQLRTIADARAKQRQTAERYFGFLSSCLLVACAAWVAVLAILNARERRAEIGLMRAVGHGSGRIAALFLGKAAIIGAAAAAAGWGLGTALALKFGPQIFQVTAKSITADLKWLWMLLVATPLFAVLATLVPAMLAVTVDPAEALE